MPQSRGGSQAWIIRAALAAGFLAAFTLLTYYVFAAIGYSWNWEAAWKYRVQFLWGWLATLGISSAAMVLSVGIGMALLAARRAPLEPLRWLGGALVEIVRGSPLLVQLMVGYYVLATALRIDSAVLVGTLILAIFHGAYLAEVFRGAVESIGASQRESAAAVGFSQVQMYRHVIIPQAVRRALPGTTGQLVSLIKDSSLLSVVGIDELVQKVRILNSSSYTALEGYLPLAAAYLVVTLPLSWWARQLERRYAYDT